MLTRNEILRRAAMNEPLPQDEHPDISEEAAHRILAAKPDLVNLAFDSAAETDSSVSMAGAIFERVKGLAAEHGWFPASVIMSIALSEHYRPDQIPTTPSLGEQTRELLERFSRAARTETNMGSEWTIPVAMLTSLGEEKALEFLSCMVFCAGFGIAMEAAK